MTALCRRLVGSSQHDILGGRRRLKPASSWKFCCPSLIKDHFCLSFSFFLIRIKSPLNSSYYQHHEVRNLLFNGLRGCSANPHRTRRRQRRILDVHIVFARGSGEMPGLGICGTPLVKGITSNLAGMSVSSYAASYLASVPQTSAGPGATDMTNHVAAVAQQCPDTVFVLGGYSQGASVTDISIGIKTMLGVGASIPETLAPRIKAIVTFGNPLKLMGQTIERSSQLHGSKVIEFCNLGDPVCANGFNTMAHITYPMDGSVTKAAAQAAALVKQGARALRG